jgi:serine/threonine-protein kinase
MVYEVLMPTNVLLYEDARIELRTPEDSILDRLRRSEITSRDADNDALLAIVDFLSPEQALDCPVDSRSDIYSLGCMFYYMLTGHPLFADGTVGRRLARHQTEIPSLNELVTRSCPQTFRDICRRMVAKSPRDRYQSAMEVADALTRWLRGLGDAV